MNIMSLRQTRALNEGPENKTQAKSSPLTVFVNKVSLSHNHASLFTYYPWVFTVSHSSVVVIGGYIRGLKAKRV